MGSDESHFNVLLIVRHKVPRQCPQTTTSEEKGEPKRNRTEVLLLTSLTSYRWATRAHWELLRQTQPVHLYLHRRHYRNIFLIFFSSANFSWLELERHLNNNYMVKRRCRTPQSSGAVWKSRWPSRAFRPNEPYGFCRRKATLNRASGLVTVCP